MFWGVDPCDAPVNSFRGSRLLFPTDPLCCDQGRCRLLFRGASGSVWCIREDAVISFTLLFMDKPPYPKYHVVGQWICGDGMMCVQAVELAQNNIQMLLGGDMAIRIALIDPQGEVANAFIVSRDLAEEMCASLQKALEACKVGKG
jgi:hypothetical protein